MALTNSYCSLADVLNSLGISDGNDDVALTIAINAASRQIDGYCGQRFWKDTAVVARLVNVVGDGRTLSLYQSDVVGIADATGLIVKSDTAGNGTYSTTLTSGTDFLLQPSNAAVENPARPYTSLLLGLSGATTSAFPAWSTRPAAQVTAKWGWPAVPDDVVQACVLQAAQLFKSKDAVFGVAAFGEFGPLRVRSAMNPIAEGLIQPYTFIPVA